MNTRMAQAAVMLALVAGAAWGQPIPAPPSGASIAPASSLAAVRIWGHGGREQDLVGALVQAWARGFQRSHPAVRIEATLRGDGTAIGGLYTGAADLALMERAPIAIELDGYKPIVGNDPFEIAIATGSLDRRGHAMAPVLFVHRDNPLRGISLQQLDAVLGADHRRGPTNIRTWGGLGLGGAWADRPITVLMPRIADEVPQFLQTAVMGGSQKWSAQLREFAPSASASPQDVARQIMQALERDPWAIAIAHWPDRTPRVKPLAVAAAAPGPYVLPTRISLQQRSYPLTRSVSLFMVRPAGQALDPTLAAFVRHVLGEEGQRAIVRDGGYLPLSPDVIRQQLEKLP